MRFKSKTKLILATSILLIIGNCAYAGDPKNMVKIDGGTFWMGADAGNKMAMPNGFNDESPQHEVELGSFWMDKYEVTNKEYSMFVEATNYITYSEQKPKVEDWPGAIPEKLVPASIVFKQPEGKVDIRNYYNWWEYKSGANWQHPEGPESDISERENHPVVHVIYDDAVNYCEWKSKEMPTEAQWEYAARGGLDKKIYTWGDQPDHIKKKMMNSYQGDFPYENENTDGYMATSPVGSFPANGYGLHDMAGNLWEWVSDWYHPRYYEVSPKENPTGVKKEESVDPVEPGVAKRVVKGGSFLCSEKYCTGYRPSARMATDPRSSSNHTGFRCVLNEKKEIVKNEN